MNPQTKKDIDQLLSEGSKYKEISIELDDNQSMTVLINGDLGWIMYLRKDGDTGFSTRNPERYETDENIEYFLNNGQCDEYPSCWAYPVSKLREALYEFWDTHQLPCCVSWHDDSLIDEK